MAENSTEKSKLKKEIILRRAQQEDLRPIIELQKKIFHFRSEERRVGKEC